MSDELTIDERQAWLRSTLEHLASIPSLSDSDLGYVVFEVLDMDVRSCLHDANLDPLVTAARVSPPMKQEFLQIRSSFLPLLEAAYAAPSLCEKIRHDRQWADISRWSSRLLAGLAS